MQGTYTFNVRCKYELLTLQFYTKVTFCGQGIKFNMHKRIQTQFSLKIRKNICRT